MNIVLKRQRTNYSEKLERWCWDIFRGAGRWFVGPSNLFPSSNFFCPSAEWQWEPNGSAIWHPRPYWKRFNSTVLHCCGYGMLWNKPDLSFQLALFSVVVVIAFCFHSPPFILHFFLSWLWWGLFLCKTSPSDLFERPALVILPDHHCMTCFYIRLTKELFDQGVWCVIVRNSASRWQPLFPKAAPWPHSIQGKTPLEWPLFIE